MSEHHLSPDCVAHVDTLIEGVARDMAEQAAARLQPVRSESRWTNGAVTAPSLGSQASR